MNLPNKINHLSVVPDMFMTPEEQTMQLTVDTMRDILSKLSAEGRGEFFVLFQDHVAFYATPATTDYIICSTDSEGYPQEGNDCVMFG